MAEVVNLSIVRVEGFPGNYNVVVSGSGFVPNRKISWRLKGDDPVIDDNIIAPRGGGIVGPEGTFSFGNTAISGNLNEDWGRDEIYAEVHYTDLGGSSHKSNIVRGMF
jgi:hypothetical protein